jgi:hypothetical protein
MKPKRPLGLAVALLLPIFLLAAACANAQQKMPSMAAAPRSTAVVHAHPAGARVVARPPAAHRSAPAIASQSSGVHFNASTSSFEFADGSPATLQDLLNPVPGLGFDYHHLSVINQDLAIKALIDPATEMKIAEARRFLRGSRFAGSGFYLLDGGFYYPVSDDSGSAEPTAASTADQSEQQPQSSQQPQVILVQQPQQQSAGDNFAEAAPESESLPDVGQFTLVLQNGQRLQAVAFTRANDKIVYITSDGFRGTISIADVNTDATKQINADRGTPIQLPL